MFKFPILPMVALLQLASAQNDGSQRTALDDYVFSDESLSQYSYIHMSEYDYTHTNPITGVGYSAYCLNMTSGEWLTEEDIGIRAHWWHIIMVVIPDNLNPAYSNNATIWVTGNSNESGDNTGVPDVNDVDMDIITTLSTGVGMPFAALYQVPNAHITFSDDPLQESRSEDAIVAYSWARYVQDTSDVEQNVYLPMVRAAVRSIDTVQDFLGELLGTPTEAFTISGASKRGWTSWLTGAMDQERVAAIVPVVWDGINLSEVFHHQWRNYGGWSFAIEDYVENGIMEYLDSPEMLDLQNLIDPYFYRTRLTMPKMAVTGLMDEFQMPDDEQYWWDEMPSGPDGSSAPSDGNTKWLLKSPDTEHSYITGLGVAIPVMGTWMTYLLNGWELPYLTWEYDESNGDITVQTFGGDVYSAQIWYASSCHDRRRDFRIVSLDDPCECGPVVDGMCSALNELWHQTPLEPNEDGSYTGHVDAPTDGRWTAFIVNIQMTTEHSFRDDPMHSFFTKFDDSKIDPEARYPITPPGVLEFTSRGSVVTNTFPYEDCTLDGCAGELV